MSVRSRAPINSMRAIALLAACIPVLSCTSVGAPDETAVVAPLDRTVVLSVPSHGAPGGDRPWLLEIDNTGNRTVSFQMGLNDTLFENKAALLEAIGDSRGQSCATSAEDQGSHTIEGPYCAAFNFLRLRLFHHIELSDQYDDNGWARKAQLWMESPMLATNSFGFGTCGIHADVLAKIWQAQGYETRRRALNGHTVSEVKVDGRWLLFDLDKRGYFVDGRILGVDDLLSNPALAGSPLHRISFPQPAYEMPQAGLDAYAAVLKASTGQWRQPGEVRSDPSDWQPLVVTLPPGSRITLPFEGHECMFPELVDFADYYGPRVFAPQHKFAKLEIPAGTTGEIASGLYPYRIDGDYEVVFGDGDTEVHRTHFDMLADFRFDRRFASHLRFLATRSKVTIYYLLNRTVQINRKNELRLHGNGVALLRARLMRAQQHATQDQDAAGCPPRSGGPAVPVLRATASSYAGGNAKLGAYLVDGKALTAWISDQKSTRDPQTITLDLGKPAAIGAIRWLPDARYGMLAPRSFTVSLGLTGADFHEVLSQHDYRARSGVWYVGSFPPTPARYVRIAIEPVKQFVVAKRHHFPVAKGHHRLVVKRYHSPLTNRSQVSLAEVEVLAAQPQ